MIACSSNANMCGQCCCRWRGKSWNLPQIPTTSTFLTLVVSASPSTQNIVYHLIPHGALLNSQLFHMDVKSIPIDFDKQSTFFTLRKQWDRIERNLMSTSSGWSGIWRSHSLSSPFKHRIGCSPEISSDKDKLFPLPFTVALLQLPHTRPIPTTLYRN